MVLQFVKKPGFLHVSFSFKFLLPYLFLLSIVTQFEVATMNPRNTGKVIHLLPQVLRQKTSKVFLSEQLTCGGHGGRNNRRSCTFQVRWEIRVESPNHVMIQICGERI